MSDWSCCRCQLSDSSRGPLPSSLRQRWDSRTDCRGSEGGDNSRGPGYRLYWHAHKHTHTVSWTQNTHSIWFQMKRGSAVSTSSLKWIIDLKWPSLLTTWLVYTLTEFKDRGLTCTLTNRFTTHRLGCFTGWLFYCWWVTGRAVTDWLTSLQTNNRLALLTAFFEWGGLLSDLLTDLQIDDGTGFLAELDTQSTGCSLLTVLYVDLFTDQQSID